MSEEIKRDEPPRGNPPKPSGKRQKAGEGEVSDAPVKEQVEDVIWQRYRKDCAKSGSPNAPEKRPEGWQPPEGWK